MKSKFQITAAGAFLFCVVALVVYLSMAPGYVPPPPPPDPPAPAVDPEPTSPTPAPAKVDVPEPQAPPPPDPIPPEPEPELLPEPATPEPETESIAGYGSIEGAVTRVTVPVPRVKITAAPDAASGDMTGLTTTTDNRGKFKLPKVPVGRAMLHLTDARAGELMQEVLVAKDTTVNVEIKLPGETATVEGYIHAGNVGLPATITITMHGDGMSQTKMVKTNDGHYVADNLLPGVIDLVAEAENPPGELHSKSDSFGLQPGEVVRKDYSFSGPTLITGRIDGVEQDEKTYVIAMFGAIESGETFTRPDEIAERLAKMTGPDKDGNYAIAELDPGTYTIIVFSMRTPEEGAPPVYQSTYQVIELADEDNLNVDLTIKW